MNIFAFLLLLATFLSALMAGFLFAFAIVVMPGIRKLGDREFLRSFRAMDRVIQNNHPLFMLMWLGSSISLIAAFVLSMSVPNELNRVLLASATFANLFLIQLPTMTINIPLNNEVQALDLEQLDEAAVGEARKEFEPRWNRWNNIRSAVSCIILLGLIVVLLRA